MQKIVIVGSVASGKTTLAKKLSEALNIPWYELDCIVRKPTKDGRVKQSPKQQVEEISRIDSTGQWIFEGVNRKSYECIFDLADRIIFLDIPIWKRRIRIVKRFVKQQIGIEKSHYKSDINMLKMMFKWSRDFEQEKLELGNRLICYNKKYVHIISDNELDSILQKII